MSFIPFSRPPRQPQRPSPISTVSVGKLQFQSGTTKQTAARWQRYMPGNAKPRQEFYKLGLLMHAFLQDIWRRAGVLLHSPAEGIRFLELSVSNLALWRNCKSSKSDPSSREDATRVIDARKRKLHRAAGWVAFDHRIFKISLRYLRIVPEERRDAR